MISIFKSTTEVISQIEEFLNLVDESSLVYKKGIKHYLKDDHANFVKSMEEVDEMEGNADNLRRSIEDILYRKSLLPEFRGDVLELLEKLDDIIDTEKENLIQFDVESPMIPEPIHEAFLDLTKTSAKSVESVVLSARNFFREPQSVKDLLHRVYFYEKEADELSNKIKRVIYKEIQDLELSRKNHIRHFVDKTEYISDVAENIADLLAILSIKRSI
jgi:predicted phosphate transport protein (TIGR00153 family)